MQPWNTPLTGAGVFLTLMSILESHGGERRPTNYKKNPTEGKVEQHNSEITRDEEQNESPGCAGVIPVSGRGDGPIYLTPAMLTLFVLSQNIPQKTPNYSLLSTDE